jgi:hypothetical protein
MKKRCDQLSELESTPSFPSSNYVPKFYLRNIVTLFTYEYKGFSRNLVYEEGVNIIGHMMILITQPCVIIINVAAVSV